ncbi:TonB-dependent receptor domain-containing protein [Brevundimonas sp. NPDC092305]|uniref:TonB-dependent receptor domain-containing protein n=1 Tax=Brevundimonas sp. NPDC092305 TaxID=3363957 RepID=UPI0037F593E0
MTRTQFRNRLLGSTMIGGLTVVAASLAMTSAAQAQSTPPQGEPTQDPATQVDDIVVTGSRIARQDYVSTSPIVTVGQEDFQDTGSVTIDTLINDLPQFVPSINSTSNNPSNGGQANINLRGLGTQRTLVLMNGRRVVPSNSDGTVDVNIIPTPLIQNVEVISGGASAAYGSDALAGVANFILNERFEGVQFDAQYGVTDRDDGATEAYSITLGGNLADDRGNMVLSVGRSTRGLIYNRDREFSSISGASAASPLGNAVFDAGNQPSQAFLNTTFGTPTVCPIPSNANAPCVAPGGSFGFNQDGSVFSYTLNRNFKSPGGIEYDGFNVAGQGSFAYNTGPLNYMQLPLDRWNAYAGASYRLSDAAEVYGNLLFTQYESANELAATPASAATGFRVPSTNPFITAGLRSLLNARPNPAGSFRLDKRFTSLGGRRATENYTVYQGTVGVRGDLVGLRDWTYDIYAQQGRMERVTVQTGNVSRSAVQQLLDAPDGGRTLCAGGFDFEGDNALSAACVAFIGRTSQNVTTYEQSVVEASLQGGLLTLPAGEMRFAAGIQYRQDDYDFRPDASLARVNPTTPHLGANGLPDGGNVGGSEIAGFNPSQPLSGVTNSVEYFVETLVPLISDVPFIQQLDLTLGYRISDYNTVGFLDAYRADLEWQVFDMLRIRGGIQHSVRAPSIGELYAPLNTSFPAIGAVTTANAGDPCDTRSSYRNGANAAAVRALCLAQGVPASVIDTYTYGNNQVGGVTGGNPNLEEETSDSFTVGAVITSPWSNPWLSGMSASVDYYDITIDNVIAAIGAATQLQGCFNAQGQNPTYDPNNGYCQLFTRDPLSGNVFEARELNANLAQLKTSGIDAQLDWRLVMGDIGLPDWGQLDINVVVGWLENRERQDVPNGLYTDRTGTIDSVFGNTFPEWKALTSIGWSNDGFGFGVRWRRIGEMTQFSTTNEIPSKDYFDLNASWAINDTVSLRATVNNLTDEEPAIYAPGVQANTDPSTYDTLGRRYSVGLTARF